MKLSLETHQIQIFPKHKRGAEAVRLWNIDGNGLCFNEVFQDFLGWLDLQDFANDFTKRVFSFDRTNATLSNTAVFQCGQFEYGEYGVANSIKNVRSKKLTHPKTKEEAEVYPLYLGLYCPKDYKKGLFVLQRYGNLGMLSQLRSTLISYFQEQYEDFTIKIEPCIPVEILRKYIETGTVSDIILSRSRLPNDADSIWREGGFLNDPKSIIVKLSGDKPLFSKDTLLKLLDGTSQPTLIIEHLKHIGIDGEAHMKVVINVNGQDHTIDFSDTGKLRPYLVLDSVGLLNPETGHPIFSSLNLIAKNYAQDILKPDIRETQS
jgi:hypothetical protein